MALSVQASNAMHFAVSKPAPDWDWVRQEMEKPDATLEQLWREWREATPDGIGYTQFTSSYRKHIKKLHIVMRRAHMPGDKLFVDFAGRTVPIQEEVVPLDWTVKSLA